MDGLEQVVELMVGAAFAAPVVATVILGVWALIWASVNWN